MRGLAIGFAVVLAGGALPAAAQKADKPEMSLFDGACASTSSVAGSPFTCDAALVTTINQGIDGQIVIFMTKVEGGGGIIGIGGVKDPDGSLRVQSVQYKPGEPVGATGNCAFTRKGRKVKAMRCETVTGSGGDERRSVIEFTAISEHRM
jgi:hypothetical protein